MRQPVERVAAIVRARGRQEAEPLGDVEEVGVDVGRRPEGEGVLQIRDLVAGRRRCRERLEQQLPDRAPVEAVLQPRRGDAGDLAGGEGEPAGTGVDLGAARHQGDLEEHRLVDVEAAGRRHVTGEDAAVRGREPPAERRVLPEDQQRPSLGAQLGCELEGERPGQRLLREPPEQPVAPVDHVAGSQVDRRRARGKVGIRGRAPRLLQPLAEADAPESRRGGVRRQSGGDAGQQLGKRDLLHLEARPSLERSPPGDARIAPAPRLPDHMGGEEVGREGLLLGQEGVGDAIDLARFPPSEAELAPEALGEYHRVYHRPEPLAEAVAPRGEEDLARRRPHHRPEPLAEAARRGARHRRCLDQHLDAGEVELAAARQAESQEARLVPASEVQDERRWPLRIALARRSGWDRNGAASSPRRRARPRPSARQRGRAAGRGGYARSPPAAHRPGRAAAPTRDRSRDRCGSRSRGRGS